MFGKGFWSEKRKRGTVDSKGTHSDYDVGIETFVSVSIILLRNLLKPQQRAKKQRELIYQQLPAFSTFNASHALSFKSPTPFGSCNVIRIRYTHT